MVHKPRPPGGAHLGPGAKSTFRALKDQLRPYLADTGFS